MNTMWDIMEDETPYISHGISAVKEVVKAINEIDVQEESEESTENNPENGVI